MLFTIISLLIVCILLCVFAYNLYYKYNNRIYGGEYTKLYISPEYITDSILKKNKTFIPSISQIYLSNDNRDIEDAKSLIEESGSLLLQNSYITFQNEQCIASALTSNRFVSDANVDLCSILELGNIVCGISCNEWSEYLMNEKNELITVFNHNDISSKLSFPIWHSRRYNLQFGKLYTTKKSETNITKFINANYSVCNVNIYIDFMYTDLSSININKSYENIHKTTFELLTNIITFCTSEEFIKNEKYCFIYRLYITPNGILLNELNEVPILDAVLFEKLFDVSDDKHNDKTNNSSRCAMHKNAQYVETSRRTDVKITDNIGKLYKIHNNEDVVNIYVKDTVGPIIENINFSKSQSFSYDEQLFFKDARGNCYNCQIEHSEDFMTHKSNLIHFITRTLRVEKLTSSYERQIRRLIEQFFGYNFQSNNDTKNAIVKTWPEFFK